jgi:hypothetical protein
MTKITLVEGGRPRRIPKNALNAFDNMGQLYLELLENKKKIKVELRTSTYQPDIIPIVNNRGDEKNHWNWDTWGEKKESDNDGDDESESERKNDAKYKGDLWDIDDSHVEESNVAENHVEESNVAENHVEESNVTDNHVEESNVVESHVEESHVDESHVEESKNENTNEKTSSPEDSRKPIKEGVTFDTDEFFSEDRAGERDEGKHDTDDENNHTASTRLSKLLNGYGDKSSQPKIRPVFRNSRPPSLAELNIKNATGRNFPKDISKSTKSQEEVDERKRILLFNFKILKRKYPEGEVPEWTMHSDLEIMERSYDETLRLLALDSSIEKNKGYLKKGFIFGEQALLYFGINKAQDFAAQEIPNITKTYESLLVELGEKQYESEFKSSLPVEVRLAGLVLFQMVSFVIGKSLFQKTGIDHTKTDRVPIDTSTVKMKGPDMDDILGSL